MHFVRSLTYDTNIVSCSILKKGKKITLRKKVEGHLNGEKVIKKDYTFSMPGNLSVFFFVKDLTCVFLQVRVVVCLVHIILW